MQPAYNIANVNKGNHLLRMMLSIVRGSFGSVNSQYS